jgi:hypothetical protein
MNSNVQAKVVWDGLVAEDGSSHENCTFRVEGQVEKPQPKDKYAFYTLSFINVSLFVASVVATLFLTVMVVWSVFRRSKFMRRVHVRVVLRKLCTEGPHSSFLTRGSGLVKKPAYDLTQMNRRDQQMIMQELDRLLGVRETYEDFVVSPRYKELRLAVANRMWHTNKPVKSSTTVQPSTTAGPTSKERPSLFKLRANSIMKPAERTTYNFTRWKVYFTQSRRTKHGKKVAGVSSNVDLRVTRSSEVLEKSEPAQVHLQKKCILKDTKEQGSDATDRKSKVTFSPAAAVVVLQEPESLESMTSLSSSFSMSSLSSLTAPTTHWVEGKDSVTEVLEAISNFGVDAKLSQSGVDVSAEHSVDKDLVGAEDLSECLVEPVNFGTDGEESIDYDITSKETGKENNRVQLKKGCIRETLDKIHLRVVMMKMSLLLCFECCCRVCCRLCRWGPCKDVSASDITMAIDFPTEEELGPTYQEIRTSLSSLTNYEPVEGQEPEDSYDLAKSEAFTGAK